MKKSDWAIVRDAEREGLMASMTSTVERKRTELNKELSDYFRKKMPNYMGCFDEYDGEEILDGINEYLKKEYPDKSKVEFPFSDGTEIHLVPITENLQLKVLVGDEYHGDGEYEKYVIIDFFVMNDSTTKGDVDILVEFTKEYLVSSSINIKPITLEVSEKITVDREVLFYAFRYALGRSSFAPCTVMDNIKENIRLVSKGDIQAYIKEIEECEHFGMEMDEKEWLLFKNYLQNELDQRDQSI